MARSGQRPAASHGSDALTDLRRFHDPVAVAAACGAVGVPGTALLATLDALGDRIRGPLALASDARLDRLGVVVAVPADAVSEAISAAGLDADPTRALLAQIAPAQVSLRVTADREDERTSEVWAGVDLSVGAALDRLGRAGATEAHLERGEAVLEALGLPLVTSLGVSMSSGAPTWWIGLAHSLTSGALHARGQALQRACVEAGASTAQAAWQKAMLDALAPGRDRADAAVRIGADPAVVVTWSDVAAETVLRVTLQFHPAPHAASALGALAAAAKAPDRASLSLWAHRGEPPTVTFAFAPS